jgi:leucyl aminopeptidase (aminopeptidase T)
MNFIKPKRYEDVVYNLEHVYKIEKLIDEYEFHFNNGRVISVKSSLVSNKIKKLFDTKYKKKNLTESKKTSESSK